MEHEELLSTVRALRARRFTPGEIAGVLGVSKADAARLVRLVACERESQATATGPGDASDRLGASQARA